MYTQIIYGTANSIYFPMIKAGSTDFAVAADWTPAATDCDLSIDGGTWTQATNTVAIAVTGAAMWKLTLTAAECTGGTIAIAIVDSATKAVEDQAIICTTQLSGQLEATKGIWICEVETATAASTTTTLEALSIGPNSTEEATADHFNGRLMLFTSGALLGQMTDITDYALANSNMSLTFTALTEAPADGDRFVIL